ncbi:hypothetical protein [Winogradskyella ursingii]|uniref:hypothetical protein n=1 Tax=Winogradskyella ursingii TaxID=2686079 RepID=UPI0015CC9DA8|nr:hypothetical protein [Winogradskyella ursingii]
MRKLLLVFTLITFTSSVFAQRGDNEWFASVGLNAINSIGSKSPINSPDEWAFKIPIAASIELVWPSGLAIEESITLNGFSENDVIDGAILTEDYTYLSFDTHVKYYFGQQLFPDFDQLDFYGLAGVGIFSIEDTNISGNLGGGILYWVNRRKTFGIKAQTVAKFALDHKFSGFDNNHFQIHLQAIFAL